ncbi:MAG: DUF2066 domain-containing protein [Xanthomonadales bacterium]|jgi:hypothetical protein|nr:DUF2066 domain-containing protein [Xanthomonadales bacterium]
MIRLLLLLSLLLSPLCAAHAVEVDVYTGEAAVADQGAREKARGLPLALKDVLQKYSGISQFDDYPQLEAALETASSMLVTFYYRNVERALADGSSLNELRLVAKFSPARIDELARSLALPLWQSDRNPLEVWVVVDNGRQRQVMTVEIAYVQESIDAMAHRRGQPLIWPEADEEGIYPVDMQLLWGGYTEDLASLNGVGVLILAARREGLEWSVRANLGYGGENWAWRIQNRDLEAGLLEGLQEAIDQVASSSAIGASDLGTWRHELTVTGLRSALDYQQCLAYLQGIGIVDHVAVVSASPSAIHFRLELNALPRYLVDAFEGDSVLQQGDSENTFLFGKGSR